ncbi:hypothetical protein GCM10009557_53180 [Virgisporangium ochraceum]|uniref:Uncharacterized protein n=1 Tax=Virgisporangium ochraceum TaxID=65505 RepID=A0A8J4EAL8_9ACTN|nr:hypothetical protein [Virgisporangium ochraceum]GIJ67674.1 hypothetical protein Voc01_025910 [Virgisporangium ochraceum]
MIVLIAGAAVTMRPPGSVAAVRTLASGEFLALADAPTVHAAVMIAARATADACDLRRYDPASRSPRLDRLGVARDLPLVGTHGHVTDHRGR